LDKLTVGYEDDFIEQFYPVYAADSALFWSNVFFAKQSVQQNSQLAVYIRSLNSHLGGKAPGFLFFNNLYLFDP
jgi:hypothetical protein